MIQPKIERPEFDGICIECNTEFIKNYHGHSTYQITVQGKVDTKFMSQLNNLSVTHTETSSQTLSTFTGEIVDQEDLSGILNILFDNRYAVISVTKIE